MDFLFPDFLNSTEEYDKAIAFWKNLISPILAETTNLWEDDWFSTTYGNGTRILDGNPIVNYICKNKRRGFLIIQIDPEEETSHFKTWVKCAFGDDFTDPDSIELLAIACKVTEFSANQAARLIRLWCRGK